MTLAQGNPGTALFPICELIGFGSLLAGICWMIIWIAGRIIARPSAAKRKTLGAGRNAIVSFVIFGLCSPFILPWGHRSRSYSLLIVDAKTGQPVELSIDDIAPDDGTDLDDPFLEDRKTIRDPNEIDATINVNATIILRCKGYQEKSVALNSSTPNPLTVALRRDTSPTTQSHPPKNRN
jgi:hypothetical protein